MAHNEMLRSYCERIGIDPAALAGRALVEAVQRAHRLAIPFENLEIALGRGIDLAPAALFDKLVTRRRGGYCFEQNALFLAGLRALGFEARPLLARVWLLVEDTPPRTHTLNLVAIDGEEYIADAGFGGGYTPPMPLRENEVTTTADGAQHRLTRDAVHGWMLERDGGAGWVQQYSFTTEAVWPADLEAANHWTATRPNTRFTTLRIVSIALPDGYASLVERTLTVNRRGEVEASEVDNAAAYRQRLRDDFGLDLSEVDVASLGLFD